MRKIGIKIISKIVKGDRNFSRNLRRVRYPKVLHEDLSLVSTGGVVV